MQHACRWLPGRRRLLRSSQGPIASVHEPFCCHGVSKYTNLERALVGLYDLVGVRWSRKRTQMPPLAEDVSGIIGQATGLVIYSRNIYFIWLGKRVPGKAKIA